MATSDIGKAAFLNARNKNTGEIEKKTLIPPAPSDGDLGGISEEELAQITTNKEKISALGEDIGNKAPAIIKKASGKTIIIDDSSNLPIKMLSGTGKIIITGKNILNTKKRNEYIPFEAKAGTLFTLITNGELSEGGNIKFIDENDEIKWFSIDKGKTRSSTKITKNIKGYINLLTLKDGLKYCFSVGENDEYEELMEQVITAPVDSEQLKAIHTNYPTTVLTSENEISVEYVVDTEEYIGKRVPEEKLDQIDKLNEDLANIGKVITSESFSEQIASTSDFSARSTATLDINHYISTGLFGGIGGFKNGHHYKLVIITSETYYVTIKSLLYGSYEDVILDSMYMQSNTPYVIDIPITIDFSNANKYVVFQQGDNYVANANIYIYDVGTISEEILNNVDFSTHKNPIEYQSVNIPKKTFHNGNIQENIIYKEDASFLGDSLTAVGSGSQYIEFVSDGLGLSNTHNCGIYGTRVSGGESSSNSFWTNKRVNELSLNSGVLFIMGGTNDAAYITVQDSDFTIENHDTNNFIGAYNVLISKVLYKYLKLSSGYYSDIDYSEVTQATKAKPYFRIILITPPKRFDSVENLKKVEETANYVIKIGELWGLPVCDVNHLMSMNIINKDNYFTHQTEKDYVHFDVNGHRELANIVVGKVKSLN